ncbi:MAG: cob(I)yrinic acid a,c-diamide adenosyltransferase [Acidilobaceae archaeon]
MGKLYTRSGDNGYTYARLGERVPKSHPLIEFYGALDEANSMIGLARSLLDQLTKEYDNELRYAQSLLFRVGFSITGRELKVSEDDVKILEDICDKYYSEPLRKFILPGGPPGVAALHVARTLVRRAERKLVNLRESGFEVDSLLIKVLNRLSDALFATALHATRKLGYSLEEIS